MSNCQTCRRALRGRWRHTCSTAPPMLAYPPPPPQHTHTPTQVRIIDRVCEIPHEGPFCDLMWSDPEDIETWAVSPRGAGWLFGRKVTAEFNQLNGGWACGCGWVGVRHAGGPALLWAGGFGEIRAHAAGVCTTRAAALGQQSARAAPQSACVRQHACSRISCSNCLLSLPV